MEKTTQYEALCSILLTQYYSGDQIKKEIGRACSMYGREKRCIQSLDRET